MYILVILLLTGQSELFEVENILDFADFLYESQDHTAALQEYRRYNFLADSLPRSIRERLIDCYVQADRYVEAYKETDLLYERNYASYVKGYVLYKQALYDSSITYLEKVGLPYKEKAQTIIGLGFAQQFNFKDAGRFISLPGDPPEQKSIVAGTLFSLFPGGGHFYCGHLEDGLFSCAVIGISTALALYYNSKNEDMKFGISLSAAIFFYAGNVYGGINAVRNYNYHVNNAYRLSVIESTDPIDPFYR